MYFDPVATELNLVRPFSVFESIHFKATLENIVIILKSKIEKRKKRNT